MMMEFTISTSQIMWLCSFITLIWGVWKSLPVVETH